MVIVKFGGSRQPLGYCGSPCNLGVGITSMVYKKGTTPTVEPSEVLESVGQ